MGYRDGELLNALFALSGRESLSDLRYEMNKSEVAHLLKKVSFSDYSLSQWAYTLSYLTGKEITVSSEADFYRILRAPEW